MKKTNFIHANGTVVQTSYPPNFDFAAISYRWLRLPEEDWWEIETPTYKAQVAAFPIDCFNKLLEWVNLNLVEEGIQHIWIDAICLNQENKSMLAQQLPEMTYLFNRARYVVAAPWLAHRCGTSLTQLYHDWTKRCWVIAEISAAKRIYYTGLKNGEVIGIRNELGKEGFCPPAETPTTKQEKQMHTCMSNLVVLVRGNRSFGSFHLDELVKIALQLEATHEEDKLYALMPAANLEEIERRRIRKDFQHLEVQMDLQGYVKSLMNCLSETNRLRLAMGVSRFKDHKATSSTAWSPGKCPSWSFGNGSEYLPAWANDEYLADSLDNSVKLNENNYLEFYGKFHKCQLTLLDIPRDKIDSYYYAEYSVSRERSVRVAYHPQLDATKVCLCMFGRDIRGRALGIILDQRKVKIGVFMMENEDWETWSLGSRIIK